MDVLLSMRHMVTQPERRRKREESTRIRAETNVLLRRRKTLLARERGGEGVSMKKMGCCGEMHGYLTRSKSRISKEIRVIKNESRKRFVAVGEIHGYSEREEQGK